VIRPRSQASGKDRPQRGRHAWRLAAAALVVCAVAATACGESDESSSSAAAKSEPAGPISLGMGVDPVFAPMYVAEAKGYFEREGLKVQLTQFAQSGEAVDGVIAGTTTVAAATPTTILSKSPSGDVQTLGSFVTDPGTYTYLAMRPGVTSAKQIKKMGMVPGSIHQWGAIMYLQDQGIDPNSVEWVPAGPPELPALLKTGNIDAFVSPEPQPSNAKKLANATLTPASEWGLTYSLVMASQGEWIKAHPKEAQGLMKALSDGAVYAEANPDETAEIIEKRTKIPKEITLNAISGMDFATRGFSAADKSALEFQVNFLVEQKLAKTQPNLDAFLSNVVVKDGA
jgi:NitT/TauT family transport system substrate-binding protein